MAIVANKVKGVRAVCVTDPYTAERAIASNNAQVITMGAQITGVSVAKMLADIWLANEFQAERSGKKVAKIDALDAQAR
jgi:ribose 5-phosphate isomerase B